MVLRYTSTGFTLGFLHRAIRTCEAYLKLNVFYNHRLFPDPGHFRFYFPSRPSTGPEIGTDSIQVSFIVWP